MLRVLPFVLLLVVSLLFASSFWQNTQLKSQYSLAYQRLVTQTDEIASLSAQIKVLESEDQRQKNILLDNTIKEIKAAFKKTIPVYENLQDIKILSKNTAKFDETFAGIISLLANENYASATSKLTQLDKDIATEKAKATTVSIPANIPVNNAPPGAGYSRQTVSTDIGNFVVSLIAADISNTKVLVDTASDGDCGNNCPTLPLATYVSRNNAFAGINGSYFCPATYPQCSGKTNSFDLLLMNKNKKYFNSDNNVYSNNPGVIFGGGYIRFVTAVSQWGRDTSIDSMLSNYPLLVFNSNVSFGGDDDPKKGSKGNRSFVSNKGNTVYIGVVHSATVAEAARVLKAMNMENALNLDDGGSTALWSGGYKLGPGRELPNAILFVRK